MSLIDVAAGSFIPPGALPPSELTPPPFPQIEDASAQLEVIKASYRRRMEHLLAVEMGGPEAVALELALCAADDKYWLNWYGFTYDPRNPLESPPLPANLPFDLVQKQIGLFDWIEYLLKIRREGACKKSRGIGFTWLAAAKAWHKWRFVDGFKTTFASRKATEVDQIGNPDSIFEKMRILYRALPRWQLPIGFNPFLHDKQMLLINPENDNTVRGEGGEEIGRGGRSTLIIIDEAAVLEHADRVEAATSANADVRIWGSTINPKNENNLFQRKYTTLPPDQVFRFHYSEHPIWTPQRIANKKKEMSPENWAAEFEIDDSFSSEDITIPATWVKASTKLKGLLEARGLKVLPSVKGVAGGDVGGGKAQSVVVARYGCIVTSPNAWTDPDTIDTALKMLDYCVKRHLPPREDQYLPVIRALRFDSVAIGQGVTATLKRNPRPGLIVTGVNTGNPASDTKWPDGEYAHEKFANMKAEGWWTARERFKKTYEVWLWASGEIAYLGKPIPHAIDECFFLPDDPNDTGLERLIAQLSQPKWHRRENGKILIESKESMTKRGLASPDYADALILTLVGAGNAERMAAFAKVNV